MSLSSGARVRGAAQEECDALVVGANTAGLAVAYFLSQWGYRTKLVDRAPRAGGFDRSFRNRNGRLFDYGLHALDHMRSKLVTRLYEHVADGKVHRIERRRGIVLRNALIPYDAPPAAWPGELRALFPSDELVDALGTAPPTREALGRCYGAPFADLIYDETLPSYPSDQIHARYGVEAWRLLVNIYPWFFPRARRQAVDSTASRRYQDRVREQPLEFVLYPDEGGFEGFAQGFLRKLAAAGTEVILGADDLGFEVDPQRLSFESVRARGRHFRAPRVYWCGPPAALCQALGLDEPADLTPDTFVLGSFEFEEPVRCDYTEVILGDPDHLINRISFPGKLALDRDDRVQLEFAHPAGAAEFEEKESWWAEQWLGSLRRLGIVAPGNALVDFDCKRLPIFYNCFGAEGRPAPELGFDEIPPESNLRPVLPTVRKVNINTRVPQFLRFLAEDLAGGRG